MCHYWDFIICVDNHQHSKVIIWYNSMPMRPARTKPVPAADNYEDARWKAHLSDSFSERNSQSRLKSSPEVLAHVGSMKAPVGHRRMWRIQVIQALTRIYLGNCNTKAPTISRSTSVISFNVWLKNIGEPMSCRLQLQLVAVVRGPK